jgi:predicted transcriptional regulator
MKKLTKAEEEIMAILWQLENAFVQDILAEYPEPKPAYNTVSTLIRILVDKGFVDYEQLGRSHRYFPVVGKEEYKKDYLNNMLGRFFDNSYKNLVNFFSDTDDLSVAELEELKKIIEQKMEKKK